MKKTLITFVSLLLLSGACWAADMETNANEAKYYDNAKVVRIKSVEGEGFVQRSYDEGNEEATANLPLFEKDTVGTTDGRLAVYLGRLNYLRLNADTVVVLEKVPQLRKTDLVVRLEQGSIYLDIENLDREKGIEIQTADCGVFLLDKGVYRINSGSDGMTEVIVMEGIAEVAGSEDSRNVRENQKIVMSRGRVEERPYYFYASEKDDFDNWNEEENREQGYARYGASRYLQGGYEDYEYEMSRSGRWTYMSDYNSYVWSPYHAGPDWRPYANGRWVWNPYYGYVWTSYDTCGWFTHHYGRWHWNYNSGWYWIPSYHWSPAWVSWFGNDHYYGWSPLSWWNRPVIIVNNRWDRHFDYHRGIPHHSRSTIIIRKNELSAANIHRVIVNKATLGQNGTIAYRGSAPSDRPVLNKVTVINARGRSVTYKQGAVVSAEKYRVQGADIKSGVYKYTPPDNSARVLYKSSDTASDGYIRSRTSSESGGSSRARYSSGSDNSSGKASARSKSDESASGGSSGKTSYRSRSGSSGSSGSSSSSSSSSGSSGTVKKKKGGTVSFLTRNNDGYSGETGAGTTTPTASYRSRTALGSGYSYRSSGSAASAGNGSEKATPGTSSRRYVGSILSAGGSSGYSQSGSGSGNYSQADGSSTKPSSASSSYNRPTSSSYYATSSASRSSASNSSYRSSSTSGNSRSSSSSSSSSGSSSSRAKKK